MCGTSADQSRISETVVLDAAVKAADALAKAVNDLTAEGGWSSPEILLSASGFGAQWKAALKMKINVRLFLFLFES